MQHPLFWDWDINDNDQSTSQHLNGIPWPSDDDLEDDSDDTEEPLDPWVEEAENDYEGEDDLNDEEDQEEADNSAGDNLE